MTTAISASHNLASLLARSARCWPQRPAIAFGRASLHDYATLASRTSRLAAALRSAGLVGGDRVALVARNVPSYIEALCACWWAGLVAVPVNARLHPHELAFVIRDSGSRWAFVDAAWHASLAAIAGEVSTLEEAIELDSPGYHRLLDESGDARPEPVAPHDPAWLFYTSGTTGRPKGVVISHANLLAMAQCFRADVEPIAPGDAILHPAPLSHGSGLYVVPHLAAAAVNVIPESGGFDPAETLELVRAYKGCLFFAAPTIVKRLVDAPELSHTPLDTLKCIVYGGGPMYVADCRHAFAALGPRLAQIYGQGESPMTITSMNRHLVADAIERGDDARLGSVGVAQTGMEVVVADASDVALPVGHVGEVLVRGPAVMRGYWHNPEATARTLANGWLHTGDVGSLDADGFLTLKDRSKDLIISGGANIYPREVEEVLLRHPDVLEVAVIGRVHDEWGEEVVACIVPRDFVPGADARRVLEASLDALCLANIARFKRPRVYHFLDELPKNHTGKVLKTELRARFAPR